MARPWAAWADLRLTCGEERRRSDTAGREVGCRGHGLAALQLQLTWGSLEGRKGASTGKEARQHGGDGNTKARRGRRQDSTAGKKGGQPAGGRGATGLGVTDGLRPVEGKKEWLESRRQGWGR